MEVPLDSSGISLHFHIYDISKLLENIKTLRTSLNGLITILPSCALMTLYLSPCYCILFPVPHCNALKITMKIQTIHNLFIET
jgi:hypothetical protein